jgi:hypothetical protein
MMHKAIFMGVNECEYENALMWSFDLQIDKHNTPPALNVGSQQNLKIGRKSSPYPNQIDSSH